MINIIIIIIDINVIIAIIIKNIIAIFKNIGILIIGTMMMFYLKERTYWPGSRVGGTRSRSTGDFNSMSRNTSGG